jgi:hypothetical protein
VTIIHVVLSVSINWANVESSDAHKLHDDNYCVFIDPDVVAIATHEAGHGIIADRLGLRVLCIEIRRGSDGLLDGFTHVDYSRARPTAWLTTVMAGAAAEDVIIGARIASRPHVGSDQDEITEALSKVNPGQRAVLMTTATQAAKRMVTVHRYAVVSLAQVLLETAASSTWDSVNIHLDGEGLLEALGGQAVAILRNAV